MDEKLMLWCQISQLIYDYITMQYVSAYIQGNNKMLQRYNKLIHILHRHNKWKKNLARKLIASRIRMTFFNLIYHLV